MIWLLIYIIGVIISFVVSINTVREVQDVYLKDFFNIFAASLLSWLTLIIIALIIIHDNWNDFVIFKKKGK